MSLLSIKIAAENAFNTKCREHAVFADIVKNYDIPTLENKLLAAYNKEKPETYCDAVLNIFIDDRRKKGESVQQSLEKVESAIPVLFASEIEELKKSPAACKDLTEIMFVSELARKYAEIMQIHSLYVKSICDIITLKNVDKTEKAKMAMAKVLEFTGTVSRYKNDAEV